MEQEQRKPVKGYERLYEVTESGRIFSFRRERFLARCDDEYGFHIVRLHKNGEAKNHHVFKVWKEAFEDLPERLFKGAKKRIY
ncbi:NUMOD4 domain-containing protein [Gracilibacillus sp. Marseille-QA3620]